MGTDILIYLRRCACVVWDQDPVWLESRRGRLQGRFCASNSWFRGLTRISEWGSGCGLTNAGGVTIQSDGRKEGISGLWICAEVPEVLLGQESELCGRCRDSWTLGRLI